MNLTTSTGSGVLPGCFTVAEAGPAAGLTFAEMALPLAGLAVTIVLARFRCFGRTVFERARVRKTPLLALDVVVGLGILLIGGQIAGSIAVQWEANDGDPVQTFTAARAVQQALLGQGIGLLPVVLYMLWRTGWMPESFRELGLSPQNVGRGLVTGLVGLIVALPVVMGLTTVVVAIGRAIGSDAPTLGHDVLQAVSESDSLAVTATLFVSAMVIAPVLEECIFRGLIQTALLGSLGWSRRWTAVVIAAFCFAMVHAGGPWQVLPGLFALGLILGWIYERTGSLLPAILVHAGFNAFNLLMVVIFQIG